MAKTGWHSLRREEKAAAVLYPNLVAENLRREMTAIAKGEGKRPPAATPLLNNKDRGAASPLGGKAK